MKKILSFVKNIGLPAFLLLAVSNGCKKDFLDRSPLGSLTYENFFQNAEQAVQATNAVYTEFRTFECVGLGYLGCTDIISDDADKGSTPNDQPPLAYIDDFTFDAANTYFGQVWRGYFRVISRANLAIARIPGIDMNAALRDRLVGECKFLRAYSYLLLVQWFGELPIIIEPLAADDYYNQTRQPVEAVYAQIESDLLAAMQVLPQKSNYPAADLGRATKGAAAGILAKLYMVKKDYPKAIEACRSVIDSGQYELLTKYSDNFLRVGENGLESIFEICAAALPATIAGPGASPYNMIQGVRGVPNLGWGFNRPSDNLVSAYENGDPRREAHRSPQPAKTAADNDDLLGHGLRPAFSFNACARRRADGPPDKRLRHQGNVSYGYGFCRGSTSAPPRGTCAPRPLICDSVALTPQNRCGRCRSANAALGFGVKHQISHNLR